MHRTALDHSPVGARGTGARPDGRQIVVGIEASDDNRTVVEWAAREARTRSVPLTLVHTWEWEGVPLWATPYHYLRRADVERAAEHILARAAQLAIDAGARDVHIVGQRGYAPDALVASSRQAAMLVVGSRHSSALARGVFGSVSICVVSEASCPVVVVPAASEAGDLSGPSAGGDVRRQVVVGLTGTQYDQSVLGFGFDFADTHDLQLQGVFCFDPHDGPFARPPADDAKRRLADSLAGWRDRFPGVVTDLVVRHGAPVDVLVEASASQAMLVVGRHTPRLRFGAVLGSTMLGVVHHARCPVAVIPPAAGRSS